MILKNIIGGTLLLSILFSINVDAFDFVDTHGRYWHESYNGYVDDYWNIRNETPIQKNGDTIIMSSSDLVYTVDSYYGTSSPYSTPTQPPLVYVGTQYNGIPIYVDFRGIYYAYYNGHLVRL